MTVDIQIDAVSKNVLARSVSLSATANGADRFRVDVLSQDASYRPSLDDEVTLTVDGTRWFGGIITNIRERGAGGLLPATRAETSRAIADARIAEHRALGGGVRHQVSAGVPRELPASDPPMPMARRRSRSCSKR